MLKAWTAASKWSTASAVAPLTGLPWRSANMVISVRGNSSLRFGSATRSCVRHTDYDLQTPIYDEEARADSELVVQLAKYFFAAINQNVSHCMARNAARETALCRRPLYQWYCNGQ